LGRCERQPIAQAPDITGESFGKLCTGRKFDKKVFVVRRSLFEELHGGILGEVEFLLHAMADVKNDA